MILRPANIAAIAALVATAVPFAGCGGSDEGEPLPQAASAALRQQLESISARVENGSPGACDDIYEPASAGGNMEAIDTTMASLPSDVDGEVRAALEESIDHLKQLVDDQCDKLEPDVTDTTTTDEPAETTTGETVTTETETVPADTDTTTETTPETTPTTPTAPQPPPEQEEQQPDLERGGAQAPGSESGD